MVQWFALCVFWKMHPSSSPSAIKAASMPAKHLTTGIAGSVFMLGAVTLVPLLIWSVVLAVAAMFRDVPALIAHSARHLFHRSHVRR
jgi:hypothetical protein